MDTASGLLSSPRRIALGADIAIVPFVVLADQLSKAWVRSTLVPHQSLPVAGDVVRLTYIRNGGAAFGLGSGDGSGLLFLVLASFATAVVLWLLLTSSPERRLPRVALGLILGGALGNIIDRVRWSSVVDFIEVGLGGHYWQIFNLADAAVTIGAVLLALTLLRGD